MIGIWNSYNIDLRTNNSYAAIFGEMGGTHFEQRYS